MRGGVWLAGLVGVLASCEPAPQVRLEEAEPNPPPEEERSWFERGVPFPRPSELPRCQPTGGETRWITELEPLSVQLSCASGLAGPRLAFTVSPLPRGARVEPGQWTLEWTPGLDQAAVYSLVIRELSSGEEGRLKIGVADRWQSAANVPVVDPSLYPEELGLPVIHLGFTQSLTRDVYRPATLVYRGHTYLAEAKYRGATSYSFPKKSYTLRFPDSDEFSDPLLGFGHRDKLVLITSFNDNSYLRHRLSFELWSRMDPAHLRVRTFSVVLFVNGEYVGLYTAADHVDTDLVRRHGLSKQGNLFKAVSYDANFSLLDRYGQPKTTLHQGLEKKDGLPVDGAPGAYADIEELTQFVATSSPEQFGPGLAARVNQREYQDWWIFVTLLLAADGGGKNAYHYHDPLGGPFRYVPWDLDAVLGQDWRTARTSPTSRLNFFSRNELFRRMMADPLLATAVRERYRQLLSGALAAPSVLSLLDQLSEQVRPSALRDEERWSAAYRGYSLWSERTDFTTFEEELLYLRRWVETRWPALEANPL